MTTPQPQHRRRLAIRCGCGALFLGSSRRCGRGFRRYRWHWKADHGRQAS